MFQSIAGQILTLLECGFIISPLKSFSLQEKKPKDSNALNIHSKELNKICAVFNKPRLASILVSNLFRWVKFWLV